MMAAGKKVVNVVGESKMEVRLLEKTKDGKISFLLKSSDVIYANTIRRLMIEEVQVMAIEDVEFRVNFYDATQFPYDPSLQPPTDAAFNSGPPASPCVNCNGAL